MEGGVVVLIACAGELFSCDNDGPNGNGFSTLMWRY